jgi:hypothetical protein
MPVKEGKKKDIPIDEDAILHDESAELFEDLADEMIEENEIGETKAMRVFSMLRDNKYGECEIWIYKKNSRNKYDLITKTTDLNIDPLSDIRDIYGGGTYRLFLKNPTTGKLLNSTDMHIAEPIKRIGQSQNDSPTEEKFLEKLVIYKQLFGGESNKSETTDLILRMMEMNNQANERMTKMMMDSERRQMEMTQTIIEKTSGGKSGITELKDAFELFNEFSGDGHKEEESAFTKMLQSPLLASIVSPVAQNLLGGEKTSKEPAKEVAYIPPVNKIEQHISQLPLEYIEQLTKENAEKCIENIYTKNKTVLTKDESRQIIETILRKKGA